MFDLSVLQTRQEILSLAVGTVLVLALFLSWWSIKRPRSPETHQSEGAPRRQTWKETFSYMPLILVLVYLACMIYSVVFISIAARYSLNY